MYKKSQMPPLPYIPGAIRPERTPGAFNPTDPLVSGGGLDVYNHRTLADIPRAYQNIPSGIANVTGNPLYDQIISTLGPMAASRLGINIKPTIPLSDKMDAISAGISARYVAPAYAQHMQSQQNRAAELMAHAFSNSIDEAQVRKVNPNWDKGQARQTMQRFFASPMGGMAMNFMPANSPIRFMTDPNNQLFSVRSYMGGAMIPKRAAKEPTKSEESDGVDYKADSQPRRLKTIPPLPIPGVSVHVKDVLPIPGTPINKEGENMANINNVKKLLNKVASQKRKPNDVGFEGYSYVEGFMAKCAEYGLNEDDVNSMLDEMEKDAQLGKAISWIGSNAAKLAPKAQAMFTRQGGNLMAKGMTAGSDLAAKGMLRGGYGLTQLGNNMRGGLIRGGRATQQFGRRLSGLEARGKDMIMGGYNTLKGKLSGLGSGALGFAGQAASGADVPDAPAPIA